MAICWKTCEFQATFQNAIIRIMKSYNALDADNQQGSLLFIKDDPSETTRRAPFSKLEMEAYLQGALHDTYKARGNRIRFSQKYRQWLEKLSLLFLNLGHRSWIYREGKRDVYDLETTAKFLDFKFNPENKSLEEQIAYIRGFFDAEGGIPHKKSDRFYIQLVQKNKQKLEVLVGCLSRLKIKCGKIHNPSVKVDDKYWRFYILAKSQKDFCRIINSWHPLKSKLIRERVVI